MAHSSAQDILHILDAAGRQWAGLQPWTAMPAEISGNGPVIVRDLALVYRWENGSGPVKISVWSGREGRLPIGSGSLLAIEPGPDAIRVKVPGREPMVMSSGSLPVRQQIGDLAAEARAAAQGHPGEHWFRDLSLISAAMKLVTLVRETAAAEEPADRNARALPHKQHLVSGLHEWLRPNLGKSVKLGDAARQFGKSPRQLIRILKETTGAGFAEHLSMHRLVLARTLLMRSGRSVMQVARTSGFNSREQFIRSFNKTFGWTPLQFRKAWNQAARTDAVLVSLCQVAARSPVLWQTPGTDSFTERHSPPVTLMVANALHDIVELFRITPQGKRTRIDVLERGGMIFVNRDTGGSCWAARMPSLGKECRFLTPDSHAVAVITPEWMA